MIHNVSLYSQYEPIEVSERNNVIGGVSINM